MKKQTCKRALSCLLALIMLLSMVPALNVSAAEAQVADVSADKQTAELKAEKPVAEVSEITGTTSDGLVYSISSGLVTITDYTGSATEVVIPSEIEGYPVTSIGESTFYECNSLTDVIIPDSVTSIGESAFEYCTELTSITIPEGVTSIAYRTFYKCIKLSSVTIPMTVTSIGDYAFYDCRPLTSITIPEGVTSIGGYAFGYCYSLENITIPSSVTSIGRNAFYFTEYTGQSYNWSYGVLYIGTALIEADISILSCTIKEGTTVIADGAFSDCSKLGRITIPSSVTSIGGGAFSDCSKLASITIPDSVTSIGGGAFELCESLESITIPSSVTSIGDSAFYYCKALTSITIPSNISNIAQRMFYGCKSLTNITIPTNITSIGNYAFSYCAKLTSITIPESVISIGYGAFEYCESLKSITIPESVTSIGSDTFERCYSLESITIPASVTSIGNYAFSYCTKLTSITIPDSVQSMGDYAFYYCTSLVSIAIPTSVTSIGSCAFFNCKALTSITIPEGVTSIEKSTFYDCTSLSSITIPDSVTSIVTYAFEGCSSLTDIYYWGTEEQWNEITIGTNNEVLTNATIHFKEVVPDGLVYEITDGEVTITGYTGSATELTIPRAIEWCPVTSIGDNAFYECKTLTSVIIPEGVTSIGDKSFMGCTSLENITIPTSVTSIGEYAFGACEVLVNITLPEGITTISNWMFWGCQKLPDITIPNSVTSIGNWAFMGCDSFDNVVIPEGVASIGVQAFAACLSLKSVTFPESLTSIGDWAFARCLYLDSISIPENVTSIGKDVFENCTFINSIVVDENNSVYDSRNNCNALIETDTNTLLRGCVNTDIPEDVTSIADKAFSDCRVLESITIPSSVTSIGDYAFAGCDILADVYYDGTEAQWNAITIGTNNESLTNATVHFKETVPEGLEYSITDGEVTITDYTGSNTSIVIPQIIEGCPVTAIGANAFLYCDSLVNVTLPDGIKSLGNYAFYMCTSLESIAIPSSVVSIGKDAFNRCDSLANITIPEEVTSVGRDAFYSTAYYNNNANWQDSVLYIGTVLIEAKSTLNGSYAIKDGTTVIADNAFYERTGLTNVTIPEGVTSIGNSAFDWCESLVSITIPSSVTSIGDGAFYFCLSLESIDIPDGIASIGTCAFYCCDSLTNITIPSSVTSVGDYAFAMCDFLTDVYYGGTEAQWNAITIGEDNECLTNATVHFAKYTVEFLDFDGTVLDSQTVKKGEAASAPESPQREGYEFLGWDKEFSNIIEDTTVTATYQKIQTIIPTGTLKVRVLGGTGFTISVDGGNARPQGSVYMNSSVPIGATITVTAMETSGATFVGWMNPVTGVVLSSEVDYTFIASGNDSINAVYNMQIEGVQVVAFKNDKSNRILDSQYYASTDAIQFPNDPTQVGFYFAGWSMTETEIQSAIANGEDVTVVATWTKAIVPVEVTVNGGTGTGTYNANSAVTVTANEAPEGEKFAYWMDAQGNIRSYNTEYKFYPTADTTVTAVFVDVDSVIDYQVLVSLDSIDTTSVADKNVFYYSWYCPEEYTFVKAALLAVNKDNYNESTFVAGTSDDNVFDRSPSGANLKPVNTFSWTKSNVTSGQTWMAMAYVQYIDAQGNIITVYSDIVQATKN